MNASGLLSSGPQLLCPPWLLIDFLAHAVFSECCNLSDLWRDAALMMHSVCHEAGGWTFLCFHLPDHYFLNQAPPPRGFHMSEINLEFSYCGWFSGKFPLWLYWGEFVSCRVRLIVSACVLMRFIVGFYCLNGPYLLRSQKTLFLWLAAGLPVVHGAGKQHGKAFS